GKNWNIVPDSTADNWTRHVYGNPQSGVLKQSQRSGGTGRKGEGRSNQSLMAADCCCVSRSRVPPRSALIRDRSETTQRLEIRARAPLNLLPRHRSGNGEARPSSRGIGPDGSLAPP